MKLNNILTKLSFLVVLFTFVAGSTFAQTNWYVNSTGGIDNINVYNGKSTSQPFATIAYAIGQAADGDIINVAAGTYTETNVSIAKSLTFVTYVFNNSNTVNISNGITVNGSGKTVNLGVTGGVFNLGTGASALVLTAGTLNISSANVVLGANATLTRGDGTINTTPTYSGKINIKYTNTADINSGAELPADLKGGTLEGAMSSNKKVTITTPVLAGTIKTDANSTFSLASNVTVTTDIDNSGKIFANGYKITIAPTADITLTKLGNIHSVTAGTPGNGIVELTGSKNITTTAGDVATLPNLSLPSSFTGTFDVKDDLTLEGDLTIASGIFTVTGSTKTIDIKGNLYRTNNTVGNFLLDNDLLKFSGSNDVVFNPGANLTLFNLEVAKSTGKKVTLSASVEMNGDLTITSGQLELGSNNIYMKGANKTFTNSGNYYSTSGNGFIVFQNNSTITGGGTFGNILVEDSVTVNDDINFSGILYINKSYFDVAATKTITFSSTLASPIIKINTTGADSAYFGNDGTLTGSVSVATGTKVSLYYLGDSSYTAGDEWNDLAANLNDVTIAVASGKTVTGPNVASTIAGTLTVNTGDTLDVSGNIYTLSGDSKTHSIKGAVVNGTLEVTGSGSAVNGSTASGDVATVNNLTFEPAADGATFTSSNLKVISGVLELQKTSTKTGASATVTLASNGTVTGNIEVGNATVGPTASITIPGSTSTVGGNLTLNKGTLTLTVATPINAVTLNDGTLVLGSDITVKGATSQVKGSIDAGGFKYTQKDANYLRTDNGSFTNGTLVLNAATADVTLSTSSDFVVPNLSTAGLSTKTITINTDTVEVSNSLTMGDSASVTVSTHLIVSGANVTVNAQAGTFTGSMLLTNSAANVLLKKDYTIPTLTINSSGTVEVHSDDEDSSPTARTLTVSSAFKNTAGTLAMGINHLNVTGSFTFTAGAITQTTGMLTWGSGTVTIPSSGFSIDNLTVNAAVDVGTKAFTVNKNLVLKNSLTTSADGKLTLGDGCLIERTASTATLAKLPAFGANTDVKYSTYTGPAVITTGKELPATVRNLTIVGGSTTPRGVTLNANVTVNGTLSLADTLTLGTKTVTMADGSTLELKIDGDKALDKAVAKAGSMMLVYNGATKTTARELGTPSSGAYPTYNGDITFKSDVQLDNKLTLNGNVKFDGGNFDINGKDVNVSGNVTQTSNGGIFVASSAAFLNFTGADNTTLSLNAKWTVDDKVKFRLAKSSNEATVTLSGGDLNFADSSATLYFQNGVLVTGSNTVVLKHSDNGLQPVQGFDRSGVTGTNASHIVGNVKKFIDPISSNAAIRLTRVEFPVGTAPASAPNYRPLALQFTTLPTSGFNLTVSHVAENPQGTNGFPITSGNLVITNYPDFYWLVKSDLTLQPSVSYDIEARAEGYTEFETDGIQNIRFVRRFDGNVNNQWVAQGGTSYDNFTDGTTPVVIVRGATGAISAQGARFTYSQLNKAPVVSHPADITVNEGDTVNVAWTVSDPDIGQTPSVAIIQKPSAASFNQSTNTLTWIVGYTDAGTHTIILSATDGSKTTLDTVVVTVNNVNRAPSFTATGAAVLADTTIKTNETLSFTYNAVDVDQDALTYSVSVPGFNGTATMSAQTGVLTLTPVTADAGNDYVVTVVVTDGTASDTTSATVSVMYSLAKGDLNGNGQPGADDASLILKYVVGTDTLNAEQMYAADVNGDGIVGAYDAAWVLYYVANGEFPTAKVSATMGTVEFGNAISENGVLSLPVTLMKAQGVLSVSAEIQLGDAVEFKNVAPRLPEGWVMFSNFENGVLKLALAGTTPLTDGDVALIGIALKDKEAAVNLTASAKLNDQIGGQMSVKVREIPTEFTVSQNYPNPFNPTTNIKYGIPQDAKVSLVIYNMLGQVVKTLVDQEQEAGYYTVRWDGTNDFGSRVSSGIYIYRITAGKYTSTMKMNLLK
ncbi:FlgD immunoglobulin-like domain containing protein [Melioribacter sp. Ez-97]|uniref:beta strand repeat-containing protein n=1 Tax=Melioribacter sp. Ez-97 TaxID=3423434 RepID=UPI003EDABA29